MALPPPFRTRRHRNSIPKDWGPAANRAFEDDLVAMRSSSKYSYHYEKKVQVWVQRQSHLWAKVRGDGGARIDRQTVSGEGRSHAADSPSHAPGGTSPASTVTLDFWTPELRAANAWCVSPPGRRLFVNWCTLQRGVLIRLTAETTNDTETYCQLRKFGL